MIRSSIRVGVGRRARRLGAFVMTAALLTATAQAATAAVPTNDLVSSPTKLALGVAVDFNSAEDARRVVFPAIRTAVAVLVQLA